MEKDQLIPVALKLMGIYFFCEALAGLPWNLINAIGEIYKYYPAKPETFIYSMIINPISYFLISFILLKKTHIFYPLLGLPKTERTPAA